MHTITFTSYEDDTEEERTLCAKWELCGTCCGDGTTVTQVRRAVEKLRTEGRDVEVYTPAFMRARYITAASWRAFTERI